MIFNIVFNVVGFTIGLILILLYLRMSNKTNKRNINLLVTARKEKEKLKFQLEEANNKNARYRDFLEKEGYDKTIN